MAMANAATAIPSTGSTSCLSANDSTPGFPGATWTSVTSGDRDKASAKACSRPPDPMTSVITRPKPNGAVNEVPCDG